MVRFTVILVVVLGLLMGALGGCGRQERSYSQATAEDTLASAIEMIRAGEPQHLTRLIWADSREYRIVLQRLGQMLGSLYVLTQVVAERYPREVAELRRQVEEAARELDARDLANTAAREPGEIRVPVIPASEEARRAQQGEFERVTQRLLADPYGLILQYADQLSVRRDTDDVSLVWWGDAPALGGLVRLQQFDGRWFFVLPLDAPFIAQYAPQTRGEWAILASIVTVLDNTLKELTEEVRAGRVGSTRQLAEKAGEIAAIPAIVAFVSYVKEMDLRQKRERVLRDFRRRVREWSRGRETLGEDPDVTRRLVEVINRAAVEGIDRLIREREVTARDQREPLPAFAEMSEVQLVITMSRWLREAGADLDLNVVHDAARVDRAAQALRQAALAPVQRIGPDGRPRM